MNRLTSDSVYAIIINMNNRIVVDTSVVISALISKKGASRAVLRNCLGGLYKPLMSNPLFQECEAVSSRDSILQRCPLRPNEIRELLNAYYSGCQWVPIYYLWRPNLRDENDNFLIELAIAGNAYCIVTNNSKDVKSGELIFPDLRVLSPEELIRGK